MGPTPHLTCEEARGGAQVNASSPPRCGAVQVRANLHKNLEQPGDQSSSLARPPVLKAVGRITGAGSSPECLLAEGFGLVEEFSRDVVLSGVVVGKSVDNDVENGVEKCVDI